jgi:hypothetical protein
MSLVFGSAIITDNISGSGISATTPILVATTVAGNLSNGFQNNSVIDGITIKTSDRILIKNQASGVENGIYNVNVSGAPTRAMDLTIGSSVAGKIFQIIGGTANADTSWTVTNDPPLDVVGSDALVFAQISRIGVANFVSGSGTSSVDRIALWDDTTGTLLKQSTNISINASDDISGINSLKFAGANILTLAGAAQSSTAVATIPNLSGVSDTFAMLNSNQTLTNKTLTAPNISTILNGGTLTLPTNTDTLVARSTSDTLTNKTITDPSNNVYANGLNTTGTAVIVNGSSAPSSGQILAATNATTASWSYQGWRAPIRVASTGNVDLFGNINGSAMDGVTLVVGNRILLKDQSSSVENGIYVVGSGAGTTIRSVDMANASSVSMVFFYCTSGTTAAGKEFVCTNVAGSDVVGTNNLTFIASGSGVSGPGSSTNTALVRWNGTSGSALFNSGVTLDDTNNLTGIASMVLETGTFDTTLIGATQTVGSPTVTIPDLAGVSGDMIINNATQTLTNKTLTAPRINQINDTNGNISIIIGANDSAVNHLTISNAASGSDPNITATGTGTNIHIDLIPKAGSVEIRNTSTTLSSELRIFQDSTTGSNYVGLKAPQANGSFTTTEYTFPINYGSNGQYLMSDGTGLLSWGIPAAGGGSTYSMTNAIATYTTTSAVYTTVNGMTITPDSGTYYVLFNASSSISSASTRFNYAIATANIVDTNTVRRYTTTGNQTSNIATALVTIGICTVNGSQTIDVRVLRFSGNGTISIFERSLYLFKLI